MEGHSTEWNGRTSEAACQRLPINAVGSDCQSLCTPAPGCVAFVREVLDRNCDVMLRVTGGRWHEQGGSTLWAPIKLAIPRTS